MRQAELADPRFRSPPPLQAGLSAQALNFTYFTADEGSVASPVRPAIEPAISSNVKAVLIANRVFSNRPNRQLLGEET